jgi:hypothetical protein
MILVWQNNTFLTRARTTGALARKDAEAKQRAPSNFSYLPTCRVKPKADGSAPERLVLSEQLTQPTGCTVLGTFGQFVPLIIDSRPDETSPGNHQKGQGDYDCTEKKKDRWHQRHSCKPERESRTIQGFLQQAILFRKGTSSRSGRRHERVVSWHSQS